MGAVPRVGAPALPSRRRRECRPARRPTRYYGPGGRDDVVTSLAIQWRWEPAPARRGGVGGRARRGSRRAIAVVMSRNRAQYSRCWPHQAMGGCASVDSPEEKGEGPTSGQTRARPHNHHSVVAHEDVVPAVAASGPYARLCNGSRGCQIPNPSERAITLRQLQHVFTCAFERCKEEGWTSTDPSKKGEPLTIMSMTLRDIVENFVKPATASERSAAPPEAAEPPQWPPATPALTRARPGLFRVPPPSRQTATARSSRCSPPARSGRCGTSATGERTRTPGCGRWRTCAGGTAAATLGPTRAEPASRCF